jgi:peptide/nickel transport system substrate-binding protein
MYSEMQLLVRDEGGSLIPFFPKFLFATRDNIGLPDKVSGVRTLDGDRFAERWWFA